MAPTPTPTPTPTPSLSPVEDIDFPALCDKILEVLRALWTFVRDICIALWSHVSQTFRTVWTWPPFEAFRNELAAALLALWEYMVLHPLTTTAIVVLAYIFIPAVYSTVKYSLLHCLGFRRQGVLRGSYAANYQSTGHGGNVPRGSTFARCQSHGARTRGGSYRYQAVTNTGYTGWN